MYRCMTCGHLFEEGEQKTSSNSFEYWGEPFSTESEVCPVCGEPFETVGLCPVCGKRFIGEDEWVCDGCFKQNIDLSIITFFYQQTDGTLMILIQELEEYGGKYFEDLVQSAIECRPAKPETLDILAHLWAENTGNIHDFKKWLGK